MDFTINNINELINKHLFLVYNANERKQILFLLCNHFAGLAASKVLAYADAKINNYVYNDIEQAVKRLAQNEPIQYVLGYEEFYGLKFKTNKSVLIPRPETEELVKWIIDENKLVNPRIIDIGTGSGCIAVALAKNIAGAKVSGIDISGQAIETAKQNAKINNVDIDFFLLDILLANNNSFSTKYNIIVSNPPYILNNEKQFIKSNVLDYEPHSALFVPNNEPLLFYKKIAKLAKHMLEPNGKIYFEINEKFGLQVVNDLKSNGFISIELRNDIFDKPRMVRGGL